MSATELRATIPAVSLSVAASPGLQQAIFANRLVFFGLIIAELGLVFFLSARVQKLAPATAATLPIRPATGQGAPMRRPRRSPARYMSPTPVGSTASVSTFAGGMTWVARPPSPSRDRSPHRRR